MKTYFITLDDFSMGGVLTALMEKAQASKGQAREYYLQVYENIKEELKNQ